MYMYILLPLTPFSPSFSPSSPFSLMPHLSKNWVVEFDKWLPDKEKEEQRKRSNNVSSNNKANRTKNKRSTQNGRLSKMPDILQQTSSPSSSPQMYTNTLPSTLPTKDTVSMPTVSLDTGNNSQVFPGDVLSEADQQFLLSCLNSDPSNHIPPSYTSLSIPPTVNNMSGSHSHTLNPNTTNSRSHTASPSVPDVQYRNFKLFVLSETVRKLETRLKVIKQWRSEGKLSLSLSLSFCVCVYVCVCVSKCVFERTCPVPTSCIAVKYTLQFTHM